MIRQAHSYFLGALSGTALIAAAVVVFVVLVSAQAFTDWPLAGLGGGGQESSSTESGKATAQGSADAIGAAGTTATAGRAGGNASGRDSTRSQSAVDGTANPSPVAGVENPVTQTGAGSAPSEGTSTPTGSGGGSTGGDSTGAGSSGSGSSGSGSSGAGGNSVSSGLTNTVNNTVSGVDKATGGALGSTGVTNTTEGVVNGVAGPESTVGQVVDKTVDAVGGLLGGNR